MGDVYCRECEMKLDEDLNLPPERHGPSDQLRAGHRPPGYRAPDWTQLTRKPDATWLAEVRDESGGGCSPYSLELPPPPLPVTS